MSDAASAMAAEMPNEALRASAEMFKADGEVIVRDGEALVRAGQPLIDQAIQLQRSLGH